MLDVDGGCGSLTNCHTKSEDLSNKWHVGRIRGGTACRDFAREGRHSGIEAPHRAAGEEAREGGCCDRSPKKSLELARQNDRAVVEAALLTTLGQCPAGVSVRWACRALGVHRTQFARHRDRQAQSTSDAPAPKNSRSKPNNALSHIEEQAVLDILNSPEFIDCSPYSVYHSLLDRGQRYCSVSTMYCLLAKKGLSASRQVRRRKASHSKPQLSATGPRQVWSWDVTLLRGPVRGVFTIYTL